MMKQSHWYKVALSAAAGFLIAAFLVFALCYCTMVFWPGSFDMAHSGFEDVDNAIAKKLSRGHNIALSKNGYLPGCSDAADEYKQVRARITWLTFAQNEVKFWPFLFAGTCIGPAILLSRNRRGQQQAPR